MGLGALPCYSYYSQTIGPTNWHLSTNDWAGYATAQWQPNKFAVFSAGLRWEREQLPPPIAALDNPAAAAHGKAAQPGQQLGSAREPRHRQRPRPLAGAAPGLRHVLRPHGKRHHRNRAHANRLAQRRSELLHAAHRRSEPHHGHQRRAAVSRTCFSGPPASVVTPGAVEFAPNFRNPEVHQAVAAIEQPLPGRIELTASAMLSLGRRLPVFIDTNLGPPDVNADHHVYRVRPGSHCYRRRHRIRRHCGNHRAWAPLRPRQITVPFYASWPSADCASGSQLNAAGQCGWLNPNYQEIDQITSSANSTYEAAMVKITRYGRRGLSLHAHYTYAHAMDWNPNESPHGPGSNFNRGVRNQQSGCAPLGRRDGDL